MFFKFVKMQALANDFIIINKNDFKNIDIKKICDRRTGIGADGLIVFENTDVLFFNTDASIADTCGNGLRCIAKYLYDKNFVNENKFKIHLINSTVEIEIKKNDIEVNMGSFKIIKSYFINFKNQNIQVAHVDLANNHLLVFLDNLENLNINDFVDHINKEIVHDANIEFINIVSKKEINMRVWERGVGETLSCGSGACASLIASNYLALTNTDVSVSMPGGSLNCKISNSNVLLTGTAEYVFSGTYGF